MTTLPLLYARIDARATRPLAARTTVAAPSATFKPVGGALHRARLRDMLDLLRGRKMAKLGSLIIIALISILLSSCQTPPRYDAIFHTGQKEISEISIIDSDDYIIVRKFDGVLIKEKLEERLHYIYFLHRGYRFLVDPGRHTLEVFHMGPQFGGQTVKLKVDALPGHRYWIHAGLNCSRRSTWTPYLRDVTNQDDAATKKFAISSTHGCPTADAL